MAAENTAFRIGSISKTFVAVAALKLAERGLIDMDRDIAAPLEPDFPAFERPASMRMLLTHSAGYKDMVTGTAVPNVSDTLPLGMGHTTFADALFGPRRIRRGPTFDIAGVHVNSCSGDSTMGRILRYGVLGKGGLLRGSIERGTRSTAKR